jgi:hypothetical protein
MSWISHESAGPEYSLRAFRDGDESALAALSSAAHAGDPGFIARSPEQWRDFYLGGPEVDAQGIVVCQRSDGAISGYAVVARSGTVFELCVEDAEQAAPVRLLLEGVEAQARRSGAPRVTISITHPGRTVRSYLAQAGYAQQERYASALPGDLLELLTPLARANFARRAPAPGKLEIRLVNDAPGFRMAPIDRLLLCVDRSGVELRTEGVETDVRVRVGLRTFMDLVFRTQNLRFHAQSARGAFVRGRLAIRPLWRFPEALRLLSLLVMPAGWYCPSGDAV